jgi:hypothetical protein
MPQASPIVQAGPYPGNGQAGLLRPNGQQWLFQKQMVPAGLVSGGAGAYGNNPSASIAVQLERIRGDSYPFGASFHIEFTDVNGNPSNPGVFEIDIQDSDIDIDTQYCQLSSLTGGLNAYYVGRIELPTFWGKFVRAYVKTLTNAVYLSVLATR